MNSRDSIEAMVSSSAVVLFIKGTKEQPYCGFSQAVVHALNVLSVDFEAYNVLEGPQFKQAVKEYAQWPTFPMLFVNNELVGGADIVAEMYQDGSLEALLSPYRKT